MSDFKIEIETDKNYSKVSVVSLYGSADNDSIISLEDAIQSVLNSESHFVVCNLENMNSITSSIVGTLMGCRTELLDRGGNLVLAGLKYDVHELLNALDANKIFSIYKDVGSAVDFYKWEYKGESEVFELVFPAELAFVPPVRQLVRRVALNKSYNKKDAFRIETITDEICNNAVEHGERKTDSEVKLKVIINRNKIEIIITNQSSPDKIEILKKMSKFLNEPNSSIDDSRGRGLALVRMLSDDIQIKNDAENGTLVHVMKLKEKE